MSVDNVDGISQYNKLYILVNQDLNMSAGLMSAQVSHITEMIAYNMISASYEWLDDIRVINYLKWRKNPITIIKKVPLKTIHEICATTNNYNYEIFQDTGTLLGDIPVITCIAFYPGIIPDNIDIYPLA